MLQWLENKLKEFRPCFKREASFKWFVILVVGFIQRSDKLGITSVIRDLILDGNLYESMRAFFYSTAWSLKSIRTKWYAIVRDSGLTYRVNGRTILVGDGVKQSKEARYMPGVKKLFQESEDSSKAEYIFGHMLGAVGIILGKSRGLLCLPLKINIQDGIQAAAKWEGSDISSESHVVQMINNSFETARTFGPSIVLLDRLFLSVSALQRLEQCNREVSDSENLLEIVTKAKSNCIAYEKPGASPKRRGRPKKRGTSVPLRSLWDQTDCFESATANLYGQTKDVKYCVKNLLWGNGYYKELRFVLVEYDGMRSILVSTDLTLSPIEIIELYGLRFKIESCFREFKQQFGGFSYHFWTKDHLQKLNHFKKKDELDPMQKVKKEEDKKAVLAKIRAIEIFVQIATIAMGLTQMLSMDEKLQPEVLNGRYLRTLPRTRISEASVMCYFRKSFFSCLLQKPESFITQIILEKQKVRGDDFSVA